MNNEELQENITYIKENCISNVKALNINVPVLKAMIARIESLAADAERWKMARKFLAVEDIENWFSSEWRGHQPNEEESVKADQAIDAAIAKEKA